MTLTEMQKSIIRDVISYGIDDIIGYPEQSKALTALTLILKEEGLSLADQATLVSWGVGEQENLFESVHLVRQIIEMPDPQIQLNLIRNDTDARGHYPAITGDEVKEYIREEIRSHIKDFEKKEVNSAPIPQMSQQIAKAYLVNAKARLNNLLTSLQDEENIRYAELAALYATISAAIAFVYYNNKIILELALDIVALTKNKQLLEAILLTVTDQEVLANTLDTAIYLNNKDMIEAILPKVTDKKVLAKGLYKAIQYNRKEMLDSILPPFFTDQEVLASVLDTAIYWNNKDIIEEILPKITNQEILSEVLNHGIYLNNKDTIEAILPKVTDQKILAKALDTAIYLNNKDTIKAILPKVTDQAILAEVLHAKELYKAIEYNRKEMLDTILPQVTDQKVLAKGLYKAIIEYNRKEMIESILPKVTDQKVLANTLDTAIGLNNKDMIEAILPQVTDQKVLANTLDTAIGLNNKDMIEAILPQVTDQEILDKALDRALTLDRPNSYKIQERIQERITELRSQAQPNMLNMMTQLVKTGNEILKEHDFLRIPAGADAMKIRTEMVPLAIDNQREKSINIENAVDASGAIALVATTLNAIGVTGLVKKLVVSPDKQTKSKSKKTAPEPIESNFKEYISQQDMDNYAKTHPFPEDTSFAKAILNDEKFKFNLKNYAESINKIEFGEEKEESIKSNKPINKGTKTR